MLAVMLCLLHTLLIVDVLPLPLLLPHLATAAAVLCRYERLLRMLESTRDFDTDEQVSGCGR